jgi:hypothetical protein
MNRACLPGWSLASFAGAKGKTDFDRYENHDSPSEANSFAALSDSARVAGVWRC